MFSQPSIGGSRNGRTDEGFRDGTGTRHEPKGSIPVLLTVGIADCRVSADTEDTLITHALGSCLGITAYDGAARIGGLLHVMLPSSDLHPEKALENPCMFVDTGFPLLLDRMRRRGALQPRLTIRVAGGARSREGAETDMFQIGRRNFIMIRKMLWDTGMMLQSHDIGGTESRTVSLVVGNGEMRVKINGSVKTI
jgi:chemotaxis protein CheD